MKFIEFTDENEGIYDLNYLLYKDKLIIRWKWPKDIELVYILKTIKEDFSLDNIDKKDLKLYTKEEYKEFNGYIETIHDIKQYKFWIFPAKEKDEDIFVLNQQNGKNEKLISTGVPNIYYCIDEIKSFKSFKSFFSKEKIVRITIDSDVELKNDVICYVKKMSSYPVNKDDGVQFDFIDRIYPGENVMPDIVVHKDEYIKVFIKDIEKYAGKYNLKQR